MRAAANHSQRCGALRAAPLLFVLCVAQAGSAQTPSVTLDAYGVLCAVEVQGQRPAPDTASGTMNLIEQERQFDVVTTRVPARIGLSFGIRAKRAPGSGVGDVRIVVTHPPLGPQGITRQSWVTPMDDVRPSLNLFSFENDHELVQGRWTFRVIDNGRPVMEQAFDVVGPWGAQEVTDICYSSEITS